ncbi:MAG TPA: universal stress protein [Streptosporangiaceae bacterium]|jgi:nucleotide-binding universal stress UspA family protein
MRDCVLVGFDGSDASRDAMEWAVDEADLRGLRLEILTATARPLFEAHIGQGDTMLEDTVAKALDDVRYTALRRRPDVRVTTRVSPDLPSGALIAERSDVALRVVGIRGRGALPGSKVGSVAYQVAAHAPGPVAVIGGEPADAPDEREVVVGVDGVRDAQVPLAAAYTEARVRKARIRAVHTWRYPVAMAPGDMMFPVYDRAAAERDEARQLAEALAGWKADDPDQVYIDEVEHAGAVETLAARSAGADLLVVGARGRFGFPMLALGSIAHGVLHHARCPVLIAR